MSAQTLEITESTKVAGMNLNASETDKSNTKFIKCRDARGHEVRGLWQRGSRFYYQTEIPGKGTRRVPLYDLDNNPVESVPEAARAKARVHSEQCLGKAPSPRHAPPFNEYILHYIGWLTDNQAKSPLTIIKEQSALCGWAKFFGSLRLNQITRKHLNDFVASRTSGEHGVSTRTANLDIIALNNLLKFAKT